MRILIHTYDYPPSYNAGANRMKVFSEIFSREGCSVSVITSAANKDYGNSISENVRVCYAPVICIGNKSLLKRLLNNISFANETFSCY